MKKRLTLLLVVVALLASSASLACGSKVGTVQAATATWIPTQKAIEIQNLQGSVKIDGLETSDFATLSIKGEVKLEIVAKPKPGDLVVVLLNRQCGAEELIILSQYIEARNYIGDLNQLSKTALDAFTDLLNAILSSYGLPPFIPAVSGWLPSKGVAYGILKADADKVETLLFVESMRGVQTSSQSMEVIEMPFSLAHKTLSGEKEVASIGPTEFHVMPTQLQEP